MTDADAPAPAPTPEERLATFRSRRAESVVQPMGSLALVNTQWVDSAQPVWGVAGTWAPREDGGSGLTVTATAADGLRVDGELVDGTVTVRGKDDASPSSIVFDEHTIGTVIAQEGGSYALRVWDSQSEAIQRFGGIDAYDYDASWVVVADFAPNPEGTTLGFQHIKDEGAEREEVIPGSITFTKDGVDYDLAGFKSGRAIQIVFADATSGEETYSVGRFLFVAPRADGKVVLDFNTAVLPPCAFSYAFNCPMPPKQNRFGVPIRAGEKNVLDREGALLH
ncbi:DUF1684 domain-containing protein [Homoserinibacter sp. YIM 151385]|uniref:DUF1684 domain-containing protein n=1 Tax=Homoserinibacter sp. YIM 151385 TaxID=2985506 RepID=UPI0022F0E600|nr:DUF1684 domain-containing protein [Homoserinibacter sp. YIM 151385]WBU38450.1 DUF1684 domain-containing protein [Homoserinibacter sp. YIM 151385]